MLNISKDNLLEVTSDRLYINNSETKVDQNGLLSEVIFGPIKKYACSCGKLISKNLHEGETCSVCHVTCENNDVRYSRFAKAILPFPIINTLSKKHFLKITTRKYKNFLNPNQNDLISSLNIYLNYDNIKDSMIFTDTYSDSCIPIRITGYYSLYLALSVLSRISPNAKKYLTYYYTDLLILPPECRLVLNLNESSRKIIKHKIVDIYIEILRLKKYVLKDNNSINSNVVHHLSSLSTLCVTRQGNSVINDSQIIMYDSIVSKFQYYADVLYLETLVLLSGKNGIIRSDFLGKNIDFSSRAVVINDPSLATHQVRIPKAAFFKLWLVEHYHYLKEHKFKDNWTGRYAQSRSRLMRPIASSEVNIDFDEYEHFDEFVEYFFTHTRQQDRLIYINRQPTLWRYGLVGVEIVGLNEHPVISVSPLIVSSLAMDFDGDTAALYRVHDHRSVSELYNNSFIMNLVEYDHNSMMLHGLSHESKYAYEVLRSSQINGELLNVILVQSINDVVYDYNINIHTSCTIASLDITVSYGIALLNKWANFKIIRITHETSSDDAVRYLLNHSISNEKYHNSLRKFVSSINWFLSTHTTETLTLPFIESCEFINKIKHNKLIAKLPKNPYLGQHIYSAIIDKIYNNIPQHYQLYKLTKSKFRKTQFSRSLVSIGYIADDSNMIDPEPVISNILMGTSEDEFFKTSFGTRKGLIDKEKNVPDAGYMQRSMVINLSSLEIIEDDCGTEHGFDIEILNPIHNKSLLNRYFFDTDGYQKLYDETYVYNNENIGKTFKFRSPITCATSNFKVCQKCIGITKFKSPYVGVMTGQYVEERLTQLTMSSFHTSGSATIQLDSDVKEYIGNQLKDICPLDDNILLEFNTEVPETIINIFIENKKFKFIGKKSNTELIFEKYTEKLENEDVGIIISKVNSILATQDKAKLMPMNLAYSEMITALHQVSELNSIFIELLFANAYVNADNKILRYALKDGDNATIVKKYSTKMLHQLQTKTLSLIFEPNKKSILNYYNNNDESPDPSIFEKIWKGNF